LNKYKMMLVEKFLNDFDNEAHEYPAAILIHLIYPNRIYKPTAIKVAHILSNDFCKEIINSDPFDLSKVCEGDCIPCRIKAFKELQS
jgi:hypothetical protein